MTALSDERRSPSDPRVISQKFVRHKSKRVSFVTEEQLPHAGPAQAARRPAKVARLLALAHHIQRAIDKGLVRNRAAVARKLGFTEARLTQVLSLLYLAPDIQLRVLEMEAVEGVEPTSEKALRAIAVAMQWDKQRSALEHKGNWGYPVGWGPIGVARKR